MANHKSAIKRIRTNARKQVSNQAYRSQTRTQVKRARIALTGSDANVAKEETVAAISILDKAVTKGIVHKRNAARRKSRMMRKLNALQAQQ